MPTEVNTADLPDFNAELPRTLVTVQVLEVDQKPSKKFEPMDAFKLQILAPDTVAHKGLVVAVAGRTATSYVSYSPKALKMSEANFRKLGFTFPARLSIPSSAEVQSGAFTTIPQIQEVTKGMVGGRFMCYATSEPQYKTDTGKWDGKPELDEVGQKIITGYRTVIDLASATTPMQDSTGNSMF